MRVPIRVKWTLALLLTGALPMGLLWSRSLSIQREGLESLERHLEAATLAEASSALELRLTEAQEATHAVGRLLTESSITDPEARLTLAQESMARATALDQVAIYNSQGKLLDAIARKGAQPPPPPAELAAPEGPSSEWLVSESSSAILAVQYRESILRAGVRRAIVLGRVAPAVIHSLLEEISRIRFDNRQDGLLLLNADRRVLSGGGFQPGELLEGRDLLSGISLPPDPFANPAEVVGEFRSARGEAMLGAAHPLPAFRLILAVRRPQSAVYVSLETARRALLLYALGFAALALALGTLLGTRATRPIRALLELSRAYGRREFQRRATITTEDELGELGESMAEMARELERSEVEIRRREKVEADLSRFLPQGVAHEIALGKKELVLGGERRLLTVLFADVVSFTSFAEHAPPERVVAFLNELFSALTEVVFRHGGTVDKFIGDAIMVFFGAPAEQVDQAARALRTARDFLRLVADQAPSWKERFAIEAQLSIGIHCGEVLVGNLGSERRMEYTAIGDAVNTAARLQSMARPGQALLSGAVAAAAGSELALVSLGEQTVRGRKQSVAVYALE